MDTDKSFEQLKYTLENRRPVLLVGAGFSMEAKNAKKQRFGTGKTLSSILFNKICKPNSEEDDELPSEENLKEVCDYIRDLGADNVEKRDQIITEHFTGCIPAEYHTLLSSYPWDYIFSLNVDTLIETIYKSTKSNLTVWNEDKHGHRNDNSTTLVKLHGCVQAKTHRYIFDSSEYRDFYISENCFLREFAHRLTENDIILLGTELQEDDIYTILDVYAKSGYTANPKFFFVTPNIQSPKLRRKFKNKDYYWIKQTTKEFLNFLKTIQTNTDRTELMREKGMLPIGQQMKKSFYESELYHGKESQYADFWGDWDVIYPSKSNWEQKIEDASNKVVCAIIGKAYCGKTCIARRLAVDLCQKGYLCFEYSFINTERIEAMLKYIQTFPSNTKLAILCDDNSATNWVHINTFLGSIPTNICKCVVLAVAKEEVFNKKRYVFNWDDSNFADLLVFPVSEQITSQYAKNIVAKLDEHNMLSVFHKYFENNHRLMEKECKKINDIIDVLYFSSNGRSFIDHIKDSIHFEDDQEKKYLLALLELGELNISIIPFPIFRSLLQGIHGPIDLDKFKESFNDWLLCENNVIKIRAHRLLRKSITDSLSEDERTEMLYRIVVGTVGQFAEGTYNQYTDLFQSALLFKRLLTSNFLSVESLDSFYINIERFCKDYSFYWVQRGLLKQQLHSFEFAESYLRKALSINPKSYQVKHALAKNDMNRGLEEIKENGNEDTFINGYNDMEALLNNPSYSKAFSYSAHTLINMQMIYSSIVNKKMDYSRCDMLVSTLCQNRLDDEVLKIVQKYINYLKGDYTDLSNKLRDYIDDYEKPGLVDQIDDDIVLFVNNESL